MQINFRKMTADEFEAFSRWSIEQQTEEVMREQNLPRAEAAEKALAEVTAMLPDGMHTKYNHLMTIEDHGESVGFLWTVQEMTQGRKQSFLCDFAIWESRRRQGYATAALALMEKKAAEAGCQESVLFVANDNLPARSLYRKCGYQFLRQFEHGQYMIKQL